MSNSYLILVRPPVRDLCIDALEDLWRNCSSILPFPPSLTTLAQPLTDTDPSPTDEDARHPTTKLLAKWRPHILTENTKPTPQPQPDEPTIPNGIKSPHLTRPTEQSSQEATQAPTAFESKAENREGSSVIAAIG